MKYNLTHTLLIVTSIFIFNSCGVKPKPINYGLDACYYCSMNIVDKIHAAQVVTTKGKVFNFDAIECMLNYSLKSEHDDIALYLTNEVPNPEKLIDATKATYLKSPGLPSPMGANLSAFKNEEDASLKFKELGGQLYNWEEINSYFMENDM
ncbi:MAG: nitrous oxide reductase accessory protein NosL [Chitinophagales bacterium]